MISLHNIHIVVVHFFTPQLILAHECSSNGHFSPQEWIICIG
jgi:hypothetical protein